MRLNIANTSHVYKPAMFIPLNCNLTQKEIDEQYEEEYKKDKNKAIIVIKNKDE